MAKVKSKGTALLQSISAVYTAIAQLTSIDVSGEKSETTETVTLDGPAHKTKDPTGYIDTATIKADVLWDPALAGHDAFQDLVRAPVPTNFKVTYADSGPTSEIFPGVGFGVDKKSSPGDMLQASIEIETSGTPT